jgi:branched-subunit amino acid aminotransferase/4-amino-4-deoxychorismate lyase
MNSEPVSSAWVWCDEGWVAEADFHLHSADRGVLQGMGAFETMRAEEGVLLREEAHLRRFARAVEILGLAKMKGENLRSVVAELCERNGCSVGIARIRLTATAGVGRMDENGAGDMARYWLTACPWHEPSVPVELGILPWRRNERSPLAGIKCTSYAENLVALRFARSQGWNEGVFLNSADEVCEAIMANIFVDRAGEILTPSLTSGCLPGIMRGEILSRGISREVSLGLDDLIACDSMWISSSLRGVVPVKSFQGMEKTIRDFPRRSP